MSSKSFALITRAYDAEVPYIESFLNYYLKIGVSEIHIVVQFGNDFEKLSKLIKEKFSQVFLHISEEEELKGSQNLAVQYVKSEYILSFDCDEFLDIPSLQYLEDENYLNVKWTIAVNLDETSTKKSTLPSFIDHQVKYVIKKERLICLKEHDCARVEGEPPIPSKYRLTHFAYRSFGDLFLKCCFGVYGDYQTASREQLERGCDDIHLLPSKFKVAAAYKKMSSTSSYKRVSREYSINSQLEDELISSSELFYLYEKLFMAFERYYSMLDTNKLALNLRRHSLFRKNKRIPHAKLSEIADESLINEVEWGHLKPKYF